jgi:ribonucleotide reductase beta subunit family protein with ferritin-like domain
MDDNFNEPLLTESKNRHVMFPVEYPDIFEMYKKHVSTFWTADELNFQQDIIDLEKLTPNEKYFINHVLAFFAASDGIVSENLGQRFSNDVPKAEVRAFYAFQNAMEQVHSESYSLLIDSYVKDPIEKNALFNAVSNFPAIKEKSDWCQKWISDVLSPFSQRLVAFAIVEGVFFSASFCAIFWMRERGLLPGLSFANQLISRDEGLHTQFACLLYSKLHKKLDESVIHEMFKEAVDIEMHFITESIPCAMIGMNSDLMKEYIKFIADYTIMMLGYKPLYHSQNPFAFMEFSSLEGKTNFFEKRVSEYSKAVITNDDFKVDIDGDF